MEARCRLGSMRIVRSGCRALHRPLRHLGYRHTDRPAWLRGSRWVAQEAGEDEGQCDSEAATPAARGADRAVGAQGTRASGSGPRACDTCRYRVERNLFLGWRGKGFGLQGSLALGWLLAAACATAVARRGWKPDP